MKNIYILLVFVIPYISVKSQEQTVGSGGEASGTGGTVSYSIGEVDYINSTSSTGTITHGVQQPFEILVTVGIAETNINLTSSAYPNPATEFVTLKIDDSRIENLSYEMFDTHGNILLKAPIRASETYISMKDLTIAVYYIKVLNNTTEVKIFKIIKTN